MNDYLELVRLDPTYRVCFSDGSEIRLPAGREAIIEEIARQFGDAEAAGVARLIEWLEELYRLEWPHFIDNSVSKVRDLAIAPLVRVAVRGGLRRLYPAVARFVTDERLRQLFSFQALYAGLSPFQAFAIYGVIAYMDTVAGVFFPKGGMHALPRALAARAREIGVTIRYGARVEEVLVTNEGVKGVRLRDGERLDASVVVVNADLPWVYEHLLPGVRRPRDPSRMTYSPSAWLMLAGFRGSAAPAAHHNIHFGADYRAAFDDLIRDKVEMRDPSILVSVPTFTDPSLAPSGHSVLSCLVPVPSLPSALDWSPDGARAFRDRHVTLLDKLGYPMGGDALVCEHITTPMDWEAAGMARGTPFSLSHRLSQTALLRPPLHPPRVPGLYFVGSGTLPGVGVPLVLVSGRLVAQAVLSEQAWGLT
jgi:phytoene desaturase